ncbi:MAG: right-handed parallel beta-helix repeat-containing protein, partial [Pseudonocardiaceae bacterium]
MINSMRAPCRLALLLPMLVVLALVLAACSSASDAQPPPTGGVAAPPDPPRQVAAVCDRTVPGPDSAPPGAITIDPAIDGDVVAKTKSNPPGSTFWLRPGTHTLGPDEFGQVAPKDGNTYLGAPGAIIDGRGLNRYAFTTQARDVRIRHLT